MAAKKGSKKAKKGGKKKVGTGSTGPRKKKAAKSR
jgi:hypothetical protein